MRLSPESPVGRPSLDLGEDEIATAIDIVCRGAAEVRASVTAGMLEVPITILVKKAMRRAKQRLGLTNIEIGGEFEVLDVDDPAAATKGRIDITAKFRQHFGDEDAYLGVECKRVAPGDATLNRAYVADGVDRFATGQYGLGHPLGMMLGYVLKLPHGTLPVDIDVRIRKSYGELAKLADMECHTDALSMHEGDVPQGIDGHLIRLIHIFVDMSPAGAAPALNLAA